MEGDVEETDDLYPFFSDTIFMTEAGTIATPMLIASDNNL